MIKRVGPNKYVVYSRDGKQKLSKPLSRASAMKRMASVEQSSQQPPAASY